MAFTSSQVLFLQRLVSERPAQRRAGDAARFFSEHFGLGLTVGRWVEYVEVHFLDAERLLRAHDLPVASLGPAASRADVASYGGLSEKSLSVAPHSGSVAVKCLGRCTLDGQPLWTPPGTYLVLTPEVAERVTCTRLLLVENLETFRTLEAYRWIDRKEFDILAVYRGDVEIPLKDAHGLVLRRSEPIWAFFDFDPAGLAMANALPQQRLERLLLPGVEWLRRAALTARGRQLYDDQLGQYGNTLSGVEHEQIRFWWRELRGLQAGVTQERMQHAPALLADGRPIADWAA